MGSRQGHREAENRRKALLLKKTKDFFPSVVNSFEIKNTSEMINTIREHELKTQ